MTNQTPQMFTADALADLRNEPAAPQAVPAAVAVEAPVPAGLAAIKPVDPGPQPFALADGRVLTLQKPNRPTKLVMAKALGQHAFNPLLSQYYEAVTYVRAIDGIPYRMPITTQEFEILITIIGDDAIDALVTRTVYGFNTFDSQADVEADFTERVKNA